MGYLVRHMQGQWQMRKDLLHEMEAVSEKALQVTQNKNQKSAEKKPAKKRQQSTGTQYLLKMMELGGAALFEARADWLAIETVFIANHLEYPLRD